MMKAKEQKKYCAKCTAHWIHGAKDGKHDNWCCRFGQPAKDVFRHCVNSNSITVKQVE